MRAATLADLLRRARRYETWRVGFDPLLTRTARLSAAALGLGLAAALASPWIAELLAAGPLLIRPGSAVAAAEWAAQRRAPLALASVGLLLLHAALALRTDGFRSGPLAWHAAACLVSGAGAGLAALLLALAALLLLNLALLALCAGLLAVALLAACAVLAAALLRRR